MAYKTAFADTVSSYLESKKIQHGFVITIATAILAGGIYYGYSIIAHQRQEDAQALFAAIYKQYTKAASADDNEQLEKTAEEFSNGYAKAKKSMLAPYFLAYSAHAYAQAGNNDQAITMLSRAVDAMSKASPYYYLFATKLAVMKLDQAHEADKPAALAALQSIVDARENIYSDMGLYYLIAYYASINDTDKVRELQKRLHSFNSSYAQENSPWAQYASTMA